MSKDSIPARVLLSNASVAEDYISFCARSKPSEDLRNKSIGGVSLGILLLVVVLSIKPT